MTDPYHLTGKITADFFRVTERIPPASLSDRDIDTISDAMVVYYHAVVGLAKIADSLKMEKVPRKKDPIGQ